MQKQSAIGVSMISQHAHGRHQQRDGPLRQNRLVAHYRLSNLRPQESHHFRSHFGFSTNASRFFFASRLALLAATNLAVAAFWASVLGFLIFSGMLYIGCQYYFVDEQ